MNKIIKRTGAVLCLAGAASLTIFTPAFGRKPTPPKNTDYVRKVIPSVKVVEVNQNFPCFFSAIVPRTFWDSPNSAFKMPLVTVANNPTSHPDIQITLGKMRNEIQLGRPTLAEAPCYIIPGEDEPRFIGRTFVNGGSVDFCNNKDIVVNETMALAGQFSCSELVFSGNLFNGTFKAELVHIPQQAKFNLDNLMFHEYGHVGGLAHIIVPNDGNSGFAVLPCVMYLGRRPDDLTTKARQPTIENPCAREKALMEALHPVP